LKDNNSIHLPNLNKGEEYVVGKRRTEKKPKFTMIGNKMKSIEIIADFSKPEAFTFKLIHNKRDYDSNVSFFSTNELTATEKNVFSKGYKALSAKGLIIRIKKGIESIYMFNPDFIIPNEYDSSLRKWLTLI